MNQPDTVKLPQNANCICRVIPAGNVNLLAFAAAGFAQAELDVDDEPIIRWRGYSPPRTRHGSGSLAESRFFAKYRYKWNNEDFILYSVIVGIFRLRLRPQHVFQHGGRFTLGIFYRSLWSGITLAYRPAPRCRFGVLRVVAAAAAASAVAIVFITVRHSVLGTRQIVFKSKQME